MRGMQNFKTLQYCTQPTSSFHMPLSVILLPLEEVFLAHSWKIVCFKMSITAGLKTQKGLPSLDGNTQHVVREGQQYSKALTITQFDFVTQSMNHS